MADEMLSKAEVAAMLSVNVSYVDRMLRERRLPFYKIGRFVRFARSDVDAYIARSKVDHGG